MLGKAKIHCQKAQRLKTSDWVYDFIFLADNNILLIPEENQLQQFVY